MVVACPIVNVSPVGNLSISSSPPGAEIWLSPVGQPLVDSGVTTTSPGTIISNLQTGTYNIRLILSGYQDYDITGVTISENITTTIPTATLIPLTGTLNIFSIPISRIFLNNIDQGTTPNSFTLSPGTYDLRLEAVSYLDYIETITVPGGGTVTRNVTMIPETVGTCPSSKHSGNTVGLQAMPTGGISPYTVRFYKKIDTNDPIQLSIFSGVGEAEIITDSYIITSADVSASTGDAFAGLAPGTIRFIVEINDACPSNSQYCAQYCDIALICLAPICDFVVT